jgi:hypothetical protein
MEVKVNATFVPSLVRVIFPMVFILNRSVIVTGSVLFWAVVACNVAIKNSDNKIFFIVITVELVFNLDDYLEQGYLFNVRSAFLVIVLYCAIIFFVVNI